MPKLFGTINERVRDRIAQALPADQWDKARRAGQPLEQLIDSAINALTPNELLQLISDETNVLYARKEQTE